jgi:hypothetical protein
MDEEGKTELALDALHRATVTFVKVRFNIMFMKTYSLFACLVPVSIIQNLGPVMALTILGGW